MVRWATVLTLVVRSVPGLLAVTLWGLLTARLDL